MKLSNLAAILTLSAALCGTTIAQTNLQDNKDEQKQLDKDHKADKSQAKADKAEKKALNSHKVKKADKKQDKANREADKAAEPQH
jgi:hypothetical protein